MHPLIFDQPIVQSILIRKAPNDQYTDTEEILAPPLGEALAPMIWLRGIQINGQWFIYSLDRPLWFTAFDIGGLYRYGYLLNQPRMNVHLVDNTEEYYRSEPDTLTVLAGTFHNLGSLGITFKKILLVFALDIGIIQIDPPGGFGEEFYRQPNIRFDLRSATINGMEIPSNPTSTASSSWGSLKYQLRGIGHE